MAHHLIYLPNEPHYLDRTKRLEKLGLANHAQGCDAMQLDSGPDGKPGLLLGWLTPQHRLFGYRPEEQTWLPSAAYGDQPSRAYWVGLWDVSPPSEEDLRLPYMHRGTYRHLGTDRWKIPQSQALKMTARLQDDGLIRFVPQRDMEWFVIDCEKRLEALHYRQNDDGTNTITWSYTHEELFRWLCRVLAINYRITPELVSHLNLLTNQTMPELYMATLGIKGVIDDG